MAVHPNLSIEQIAQTPNSRDQLLAWRGIFELLSESAYLHVYAAIPGGPLG